ncbi:MAG: DUF1640 domain-containing protein [SAR324 cluster bacterium]|nr:DUF1640 domain-containing protein [SAR324 cluster bacterium]
MAFDTLTYAKKLQEAGVPPQQAETHAWALKETVEDTLATKQDLREQDTRIDGRFNELETRIDGRFRLLYWMLGFNLVLTLFIFSLTAGILLKLLAG